MINFTDWVAAQESSAFTRLRRDAALGLKPPIPDASMHSHSTAPAWMVPKKRKRNVRKRNNKSLSYMTGFYYF
jgi:hypothetical protein